ncbi:MAG TPA: Wzz/FepE/Etk N-terminal domain-containing protein, partial [Kineosporiaceae bacterium]|nr:Wzz/FepE/Etk N-terminal domain-containing protein [Kineosporiaceae bacterium]
MDLPEYARALRRRWVWVIAPLLIILAGAAYLAGASPRTYESTATLFYVESGQTSTAPDTRLNSYVTLATSDRLVAAVRDSLHLATPAADLSKHLSAQFVPSTLILVLTATDSTAQGARRLAAEAARQLVALSSS